MYTKIKSWVLANPFAVITSLLAIALVIYMLRGSNLQRIYHLATFPNNFSEDIRPFNSWKAATFNAGVDKYIDTYYNDLLEGTSGYDLNNAYDWGGSHITQPAHDIVANKIITNL